MICLLVNRRFVYLECVPGSNELLETIFVTQLTLICCFGTLTKPIVQCVYSYVGSNIAGHEYNVSFASVDLTKMAAHRLKLMKRLLDNVTELMAKESVRPIYPPTTYRISELETAFRMLQTGKAMGKIVVVPHPGDYVNVRYSCIWISSKKMLT